MQRHCGNKASGSIQSERGSVKALMQNLAGHFQVVRDDRNGCSRYRAAEMPHHGVIRVVP